MITCKLICYNDSFHLAQIFTDRIHIFKCHIEGAEERLFSDNADEWLCRTDGIAIEIHGRRAHEIVYDATLRHDFTAEVDHRLHYFTRRKVIE